MMKQNKFVSIRTKMIRFCVLLVCAWIVLVVFLIFLNHTHSRRLFAIQDVQQLFSGFYAELDDSDRTLLQYCSAAENDRSAYLVDHQLHLQAFLDTAASLQGLTDHAVIDDYYHMAVSYAQKAQLVTGADADSTAAELQNLFGEANSIKLFLEQGYIRLWNEINAYCEELETQALNIQKRSLSATVLLVLVLLVLSLTTTVRFSGRLLYPIHSLTNTVREERSQLSVFPPQNTSRMDIHAIANDETRILASSVYKLLDSEHKQVQILKENERLAMQLKEQEVREAFIQSQYHRARLQMMQSLVNPHFLFNTLAVISDTALTEEAPKTEEAIGKLSVFLRYSLANLTHTVTIAKEIDNLRIYFDIQKLRFHDRFCFRIEADPECEMLQVPAIILQPLAENAMKHGIGSYRSGGWIRCRIEKNDTHAILSVTDNGVGMEQQEIDALEERILDGLEGDLSYGIGLVLVYYRMQDYFNNECRLSITSTPGTETCIRISFPLTTT